MELRNSIWAGMNELGAWKPLIILVRVALPMNKVLKATTTKTRIHNFFHFKLFLAIYEVRGRASVRIGMKITVDDSGAKFGDMKDWMDTPLNRQL